MSQEPIVQKMMLARTLRAMINDALDHAAGLAMRAQEATEGDEVTLAFNEARKAIAQFKAGHPAMVALSSAVLKDMK